VKKKLSTASAGKSRKLFESDDETDPFFIGPNKPPNSKTGQPKKQSLFGDDESDNDDDLFSSNSKSTSKTFSNEKLSTMVRKQTTKAVDDPLKDLLNT